jgi:hypothetical protein
MRSKPLDSPKCTGVEEATGLAIATITTAAVNDKMKLTEEDRIYRPIFSRIFKSMSPELYPDLFILTCNQQHPGRAVGPVP